MKIRSYFPRFYALFLIIIAVTYSIVAYFFIKYDFYIAVFVLLIIAICYINSVILYDDRIVILQFYQLIRIKFDLIEKIEFGNYREGIPAIIFYVRNGKRKVFFYKLYTKEASIEFIKYALKINNNIELDSKVKAFIGSNSY